MREEARLFKRNGVWSAGAPRVATGDSRSREVGADESPVLFQRFDQFLSTLRTGLGKFRDDLSRIVHWEQVEQACDTPGNIVVKKVAGGVGVNLVQHLGGAGIV